MGVWNGNLRNSAFDIAIDLQVLMSFRSEHWNNEHRLVIVALALAYLPQIIRLSTASSTEGLSPYFLLFNAINSNLQLAHALLLAGYGYPTTETPILALIGSGDVTGMKALGGILGLLQVACQWICSMMLYVFAQVLLFQFTSQLLIRISIILYSHHSSSRAASSNGNRTIAIAVFAHAAIFLVPAMLISLPKPAPREMGSSIFMGLSLIVNTWVALCFVILQFWPQYLEMRRMSGAPGALSLISLGSQAACLLVVAFRWLSRLGSPLWEQQPVTLSQWYQWGQLPFSYILYAIGCAVLLFGYTGLGNRVVENKVARDGEPLLL